MVKLSNYSSLIQAGDQLISAIAGLIGIPVIDKGKSLYQLLSAPKTVGESMLFDNFKMFLRADPANQGIFNPDEFNSNVLSELGTKLAEASPNDEADYLGDESRLRGYAKKIIKIIWECDSEEKAEYMANLTRAFIRGLISKEQYFKLSRCIATLTENDLQIIGDEAREGNVIAEAEYIEEFSGLGLMYSVAGGACYSHKAILLRQYAIQYNCESTPGSNLPSIPRATFTPFASTDDTDGIFDSHGNKNEGKAS
ncbi:hypothetical protein [uncultured Phocaeicola sp.]|uniref:hypothetical protein n=1 Tax=uncultured Phocaeicola sp. TaxID=990718 RepID=UPI0025AB939B|nr:hypothetical protein [uncultured Phocaeicola sp.]